uniref:EMB2773 (EMBRYO DEFECTIVE 2773) n=1 Tax=Arundo donax TaxID=35708 RepID=A0A0A9E252_ARUDO
MTSWLLGMLGPEFEAELSVSFFLTFGFFEATESGVSSLRSCSLCDSISSRENTGSFHVLFRLGARSSKCFSHS